MDAPANLSEPTQKLRFYQKGTFTVGNRLVSAPERAVQASIDRSNALTCGHRACQGCGEALGARYALDAAMRATGGDLIAVNATGCLEVFTTPYPETSWQVPWLHSLFGNAAAVATGVAAAMRVKGRENVRVLAQGGDGGTTDIGFGCLSGMFERNDDVLYVCYDNEGYMNTGVQRSSRDAADSSHRNDPGSWRRARQRVRHRQERAEDRRRARHPLCRDRHGRRPARPRAQGDTGDGIRGARYIHVHVPCPLGWGSASHDTIRLARLAVECGLFPVFEAEHGVVTGSRKIRRQVPVAEYLKPQRRFAHLFKDSDGRRDASTGCNAWRIATSPNTTCSLPREKPDGPPLRHHARRRHEPHEPDRLLAHRAPDLCRPPAALQQRLPGGREHPELAVPRGIRRLRERLARAHRGQPVAGGHGAGLLSPVRERVQPRHHRQRGRHQLGRALPRRRGDQTRLEPPDARRRDRETRARRRRRPVRPRRPPII